VCIHQSHVEILDSTGARQRGARSKLMASLSPPFLLLFLLIPSSPFPFHSLYSLRLLPFSFVARFLLFQLGGLRERCELPQRGRPAEPQPKSIQVHFTLKFKSGGNNFNDFPENQLPKFYRIGIVSPYQISHWYGGRPSHVDYLPYRFRYHWRCVSNSLFYATIGRRLKTYISGQR